MLVCRSGKSHYGTFLILGNGNGFVDLNIYAESGKICNYKNISLKRAEKILNNRGEEKVDVTDLEWS
jgi:hypothetical protein